MVKNQKGFSLISVLISAGLIGVIAMGVSSIMKNGLSFQKHIETWENENSLKNEITLILKNPAFCKASLQPYGPFSKKNIDEESEGLDVSLWMSSSGNQTRSKKMFSGENFSEGEDASSYKGIKIKSIKLLMNNPTSPAGRNYQESQYHNDRGEIKVVTEKTVMGTTNREKIHTFPVQLEMQTDKNGLTTILSCSYQNSADLKEQFKGLEIARFNFDSSNTPPHPLGINVAKLEKNLEDFPEAKYLLVKGYCGIRFHKNKDCSGGYSKTYISFIKNSSSLNRRKSSSKNISDAGLLELCSESIENQRDTGSVMLPIPEADGFKLKLDGSYRPPNKVGEGNHYDCDGYWKIEAFIYR